MIIKTLVKLHPVSKQIFYHTGLSKTGSTFLQAQVFPKLKGLYYLPTNRYRKALELIPQVEDDKVLVSREFDQQFEKEVVKFSKQYPKAQPIIVFREPGSWAVSNYKRFVKNGHPINFSAFIDIENDQGLFKKQDFAYTRYIQLLKENFESEPLILLYEDLKKSPENYLKTLTDFMGIALDLSRVNLSPKHVSYPPKSLRLVRSVSPYIQFQKKLEVHRKPKGFLYNLYANILRYILLYGAMPLPEHWLPDNPLFNQEEVEAVSAYFAKEWEFVKDKAAKID